MFLKIFSSLFLLFTGLFICGCRYVDGPDFSLIPPEKRIEREWIIDLVFDLSTNTDITSDYKDYTVTYYKDGTFQLKLNDTLSSDGEWKFTNNKTVIDVSNLTSYKPDPFPSNFDQEIYKLTTHELKTHYQELNITWRAL